ncbi:MAG: hypothetical protein KDC38_18055, partial [Planctomycetes bacterium]|nr:hypothetical protein [Planctomycetota bacterium]
MGRRTTALGPDRIARAPTGAAVVALLRVAVRSRVWVATAVAALSAVSCSVLSIPLDARSVSLLFFCTFAVYSWDDAFDARRAGRDDRRALERGIAGTLAIAITLFICPWTTCRVVILGGAGCLLYGVRLGGI